MRGTIDAMADDIETELEGADPTEIRSLTLMRTPKYEFPLDDSERGVSVSDEDHQEDSDLLVAVEFHGKEVRIVSQGSEYVLDCTRVCAEEFEDAKKVFDAMNFDNRFRLMIT